MGVDVDAEVVILDASEESMPLEDLAADWERNAVGISE